ncbi:monocarboxylate transporter 13-like isoform X1 [Podarcis raffonei]|uniref:monocarboxylate transporter 13-like isoform X1 n=1 Tax=Podarcis raffonei TaxID=65483 RepID=UPI00232960A0|nr:monocarboxylate transporter 13-like isoform X1 [Podarcis raffonei]
MSPRVYSEPPDGGWGWAITLACFMQSALVFGVTRPFGIFFVEFMAYFDEPSSATSWISSITVATSKFTSPLAGALATQYGERPVAMAGGLLSGLGYFLAFFATNLAQLYIFIGVFTGIGGTFALWPSLALLSRYFERRRPLATSLALSGAGVASLALSPFFQFLVDLYGWRGALLLVSGMVFHLLPCGALLRPLTLPEDDALAAPPEQAVSWRHRLSSLFGLSLLRHRGFVTYTCCGVLNAAGFFVPLVHLVPHARELDFDEYQAAFLASAVGVADIGGRVACTWLVTCGPLRLCHHLTLWSFLTGVSVLAVPLGRSYGAVLAISACYGFLAGAVLPLRVSTLVEIVGPARIMGAIGLINLMESVGALSGPPLSGWIRDVSGSYKASFLTGGCFLVAGSLGLLLLPGYFSLQTPRLPKQNQEGSKPEDPWNPSQQNGVCLA